MLYTTTHIQFNRMQSKARKRMKSKNKISQKCAFSGPKNILVCISWFGSQTISILFRQISFILISCESMSKLSIWTKAKKMNWKEKKISRWWICWLLTHNEIEWIRKTSPTEINSCGFFHHFRTNTQQTTLTNSCVSKCTIHFNSFHTALHFRNLLQMKMMMDVEFSTISFKLNQTKWITWFCNLIVCLLLTRRVCIDYKNACLKNNVYVRACMCQISSQQQRGKKLKIKSHFYTNFLIFFVSHSTSITRRF